MTSALAPRPMQHQAPGRTASTDPTALVARQRLYRYETPPLDVAGVLAYTLRDVNGVVVDAGCGNGRYLRSIASPDRPVLGVDVSLPMLAAARAATGSRALVAANLAALPFAEASVAAAACIHVLYLVRDPVAALTELFRVVRPGGLVLVGTTARDDKVLVRRLLSAALSERLDPEMVAERYLHRRFELDAAVHTMRALADDVTLYDLRSEITLDAANPLIGYIASLQGIYVPPLTSAQWRAVVREIADALAAMRRSDPGGIRIQTHVGVVVGRRR